MFLVLDLEKTLFAKFIFRLCGRTKRIKHFQSEFQWNGSITIKRGSPCRKDAFALSTHFGTFCNNGCSKHGPKAPKKWYRHPFGHPNWSHVLLAVANVWVGFRQVWIEHFCLKSANDKVVIVDCSSARLGHGAATKNNCYVEANWTNKNFITSRLSSNRKIWKRAGMRTGTFLSTRTLIRTFRTRTTWSTPMTSTTLMTSLMRKKMKNQDPRTKRRKGFISLNKIPLERILDWLATSPYKGSVYIVLKGSKCKELELFFWASQPHRFGQHSQVTFLNGPAQLL